MTLEFLYWISEAQHFATLPHTTYAIKRHIAYVAISLGTKFLFSPWRKPHTHQPLAS